MEASLSRIDKRPFSPKTPRDDWPRMLVVEENELMRRLIAETLAHEAHVITAANGVDGLTLAGTPGLDLIVTGLLLPGLSDVEMIGAIRQRPDLDNLPILIVTALADETMRVRMLREGAQDYIVKPFAPHELRVRAVNLANVKRARDVLRAELESQSSDLEALAREMTVVKKRAEDAQRKADAVSRAKDEFLAVLSHELRTPLNATAQARLVEDLLDVSAMVRGAIRVRLDPVTLRPILAAALDAVRPTCEVERIAVHWHCDEGELAVLGDGDRL